jgi:hypothetical protein
LHSLLPNVFARALAIVNRLLPEAGGVGQQAKKGEESFSAWSPSPLTWLNERAAVRNNEIGSSSATSASQRR